MKKVRQHRIQLFAPNDDTNTVGDINPSGSGTSLGFRWAAIEFVKADEKIQNKGPEATITANVNIWPVENLNCSCWFVFRNQRYEIIGVLTDPLKLEQQVIGIISGV